jgi:PAS domain S-box-containing protein
MWTSPSFRSYVLPAVLVLLAAVPTAALTPLLERSTFLAFLGAVIVAAWIGGLRGGLVTTGLSVLAALALFTWRGTVSRPSDLLRLAAFVLLASWISILSERTQRIHARTLRQAEELRRSEENYRKIVELAEEGVWVVDALRRTTYVNDRLTRMLGASRDGLLGRPLADHVASAPGHLDDLWARVERGATVHRELRFRRQDGGVIYVRCGCSPLMADTFTGAVLMITDITAQKRDRETRERAEAERAALLAEADRARREAEAASRSKDEFLATLSHELRTPLTSIVGWTKMLRSGQLDPETAARAIETIDRNARLQTRLIADVLDLSRIVSGRLRLTLNPLELSPVLEAVLDIVRPVAEAKGITLRKVVDEYPCLVSGDADRLQQVVWNLLSNAIKFTPRGGTVDLCLSCRSSEAEIMVADTGVGIGPELLPHVFERFRQGDASSTRSYGGLGLGLAIARHLVELHGGRIEAESPGAGQGTKFRIRLPRLLESVAAARANLEMERRRREEADGVPASANATLEGIRVLVVDDEPDARDLVATILQHNGAEVVTSDSAAQALDLVEAVHPDVLLSDLEMPGESGYSLIGKIRRLPPERGGRIPAAALTAYARQEDRTRALRAGFQMHVPKPLNPTELATIVASLAGRLELVSG